MALVDRPPVLGTFVVRSVARCTMRFLVVALFLAGCSEDLYAKCDRLCREAADCDGVAVDNETMAYAAMACVEAAKKDSDHFRKVHFFLDRRGCVKPSQTTAP